MLMKEKVKEAFDLDRIQEYVERNIDQTDWIEDMFGERRRILVVDTLFDSWNGAYIPGLVLELFGQADEYDLEDPYNWDKNEMIYDALEYLENEVNDCLNQLLPSKGWYYMGYHPYDGSYCLFYEETVEDNLVPWQDLKLFNTDNQEITDPDEIRQALTEFHEYGSISGYFFRSIGAQHEDPEDSSTWGPELPEHVDWTGF
jgi:hypothetical protein